VARGLRLAAGDADLLAHECVEQRGFTHVGLADDGDQAAALAAWGGAALQIQCRARRFVLACILRGGRRLVRTLRIAVQRGGEHGVEFCRGLR
jgi:hypothetical protein